MSCPYNQVCFNNTIKSITSLSESAVGECVYCERDRLKGELAEAQDKIAGLEKSNDNLKASADINAEKAELWDWCIAHPAEVHSLIEGIRLNVIAFSQHGAAFEAAVKAAKEPT